MGARVMSDIARLKGGRRRAHKACAATPPSVASTLRHMVKFVTPLLHFLADQPVLLVFLLIGAGMEPQEAMKQVGAVVEGYFAAASGYAMAKKFGVEMPITEATYNVLYNGAPLKETFASLMTRAKTHETEESWL